MASGVINNVISNLSHFIVGTVKSGNPYTFKSSSNSTHVSAIVFAYIDGYGSALLCLSASSSSVNVKNMMDNSTWSNAAFSFSASTNGVTISSTRTDGSSFFIIRR